MSESRYTLINKIYQYAFKIRQAGYLQLAGDLHFLVAYLESVNWNNPLKYNSSIDTLHLWPHPAGKNTIDAYSHDCPIPYEPICWDSINLEEAAIVNRCLHELLSIVDSEVEKTAIYAFIGESGEDIDDPLEPNRSMYILGMSGVTSAEVTPDSDDWETLRYDNNGTIVSSSRDSFYNRGDRFIVDRIQTNVKRLGSSYDLAVGEL